MPMWVKINRYWHMECEYSNLGVCTENRLMASCLNVEEKVFLFFLLEIAAKLAIVN